jgi:hypothetical protein
MSFTFTVESIRIIIPDIKSLNRFYNPKPRPTSKAAEPEIKTDKLKPNICKLIIKEKMIMKYFIKL